MKEELRKLSIDYLKTRDSYVQVTLNRSHPLQSHNLDQLQKTKDYRATLLADFILNHLDEIIRCVEATKPKPS